MLVASLRLIGRKEGVWIIFAAQGATSASRTLPSSQP